MNEAEQAQPGEGETAGNPDLDQLAAEAARVDNGGEDPPPAGGAQPPGDDRAGAGEHSISTARLVAGVLLGSGNLMAMRYPAVKRVYTEHRCAMVGEAVAPVLDRWGINATNSVAMQYLVAIGALAMLGFDTVEVLRHSTHQGHQPPPGAPTPKPVP